MTHACIICGKRFADLARAEECELLHQHAERAAIAAKRCIVCGDQATRGARCKSCDLDSSWKRS